MPGDRRARVVADDHRRRRLQRVEQPDHVADEVQDRVLVDRMRRIGLAVATHSGGHRVEAGRRERQQLVAPRDPALWKAVAQHD